VSGVGCHFARTPVVFSAHLMDVHFLQIFFFSHLTRQAQRTRPTRTSQASNSDKGSTPRLVPYAFPRRRLQQVMNQSRQQAARASSGCSPRPRCRVLRMLLIIIIRASCLTYSGPLEQGGWVERKEKKTKEERRGGKEREKEKRKEKRKSPMAFSLLMRGSVRVPVKSFTQTYSK
jgi:hypothetical protein